MRGSQSSTSPMQAQPWNAPDFLPEKPHDLEYGYRSRGKLHPCTRLRLIEACSRDEVPGIDLVWTPEHDRLVPAEAVAELRRPVLIRRRSRALQPLAHGMVPLIAFGAMYWLSRGDPTYSRGTLLMLLIFGVVPTVEAMAKLAHHWWHGERNLAADAEMVRFHIWLGERASLWTWPLVSIIVALFALQWWAGMAASVAAAGLVKPAAWAGEWWRLLTATLLHGNVLHLLMNAVALAALGRLIEVLGRRSLLPIVFLGGALAGSACSLWFLPNATSVGASGGIMGLLGFAAVLGWRARVLPPGFTRSLVVGIAMTAAIGVIASEVIDNAAHAGGLVAGVFLALLLVRRGGAIVGSGRAWLPVGATISAIVLALAAVLAAHQVYTSPHT